MCQGVSKIGPCWIVFSEKRVYVLKILGGPVPLSLALRLLLGVSNDTGCCCWALTNNWSIRGKPLVLAIHKAL